MSDAEVLNDSAAEESSSAEAPAVRRRARWSDDPVVRFMMFAAFGLVVLFLATVVGVLVTGVANVGSPRTLAEKEIALGEAQLRKGDTNPATWEAYISALVANKQYARARKVLEDGRATLKPEAGPYLLVAEARLLRAQGDYDEAIETANKATTQMKKTYDETIKAGGQAALTAKADGLPEDYFAAILIRALCYEDLKQWDKAVEQYDIYIKEYPTAADILVDRGNAKVEAGDTKGAEADFRRALQFIPDNEEATEGLAKIGVER